MWDFYDRRALERIRLPRDAISPAELARRWGARLARRKRIYLVLAHEETKDPDYYVGCLRKVLEELRGGPFQVVPPILFNRSWGVRVAIFNRR